MSQKPATSPSDPVSTSSIPPASLERPIAKAEPTTPAVASALVARPKNSVVAGAIPLEDAVLFLRKHLRKEKGRNSLQLAFGQGDFPYQTYPYTKGPDLANDGIGYGEVLSVEVCRMVDCVGRGDGKPQQELMAATGFSRRTRSGRQVITEDDPGVQWKINHR